MSKQIDTNHAPQLPLPFSQGLQAGDFIYVSGQVGYDPKTLELTGEDVASQTAQSLKNIEAILQAAGVTLDHVIKVNAHLSSGELIPEFNRVYQEIFTSPYPTRTTVVSGIGKFLVEIDVVAYAPSRRGE